MGGKPKQATRTKNNMRPSSSGRSAELLGQAVPGFVGFTTVENSGVVPIVPGFATTQELMMTDELDANIDDNFKILLKKLSKKDPVTKQKGLQEFGELVKESDLEIVKPVLPLWPRLYNQLSTDSDLRVREFTQQAHAALVTKAGKFIAPFVKQLAGPWIASKFDTHAIAGSLAAGAFQKSFPTEEKQKNLLIFCEAELIDFYTKNLTVHTATTLLNPKNHTSEELEAKYQRVVIGSLRAYAYYLKKVPFEEQKCGEKSTELIENPKFWSFHKSKDSGIKSAWFEVVSTCLRHSPSYLETRHEALTAIAFQNMDENDSLVVSYVWATIVLVQASIENWHEFVSRDKVFIPKLWKLLKSGGSGNAVAIYPHLLPLVSKLNENFLGDMSDFYKNFFAAVREGLQGVVNIKSEFVAIIIGYYEALKYVYIQLSSQDNTYSLAEQLLDNHLIAIIYWGINSEQNYVPKQLFSHIAALISYWNHSSKQQTGDFYAKLLNRFWSETYLVLKSTTESQTNIEKITSAHIELILALKNCTGITKPKHSNVKFNVTGADEVDSPTTDTPVESTFDADLTQLVQKLCVVYVDNAKSCKNGTYVLKLERIVKDFATKSLFECLEEGQNLMKVFNTFEEWLKDENLRSESVVELSLMMMKHVTQEEKTEILERMAKIQVKEVQSWVLLRLLSHPLCQEPCVASILTLPEVQSHLITCAKAVVANDTLDNLNLLHKCFFQNEAGEILINVTTCESIVDTINEAFDCTDKASLDTCASFIAQIMPVICSDDQKLALQHRTFMKLFAFSVKSVVSDDLSEDTLWEVTTAWQDSLSSGDIKLTENLLTECAEIIKHQIQEETEPEGFERLSELCSKLINCSTEDLHEEEKLAAVTNVFKALVMPNEPSFTANLNKFIELSVYLEALNSYILTEDLTFPQLRTLRCENCPELLSEMTKQALFKSCLLFKLTCSTKKRKITTSVCEGEVPMDVDVVKDEDEEELTEDYVNIDEGLLKDWTDGLYEQALDVIKAAAVGDVLVNYGFSKYHEDNFIYLSEKTSSLLEKIPDKLQHHIKSLIFNLVQSQAGFASRTLPLLQNLSSEFSDPENASIIILEDVTENFKRDQSLNVYSSVLQALTPVLQPGGLPIIPNLFENHENLYVKVVAERMLIENHFGGTSNEMQDKKIIGNGLIILHEILMKQKQEAFLLYNTDISQVEGKKVAIVVQIVHLISAILRYFPTELDGTRWDFVRLALSSWVLSVSKCAGQLENETVTIFITAVFGLFKELVGFFEIEKTKSSTELLSKVIVEWEEVFAKENNLVLLKTFMTLVNAAHKNFLLKSELFQKLVNPIAQIDIRSIVEAGKLDTKTSLDDFTAFLIDNLDDQCHAIRICCANLLRNLTPELLSLDLALLQKRNESFETQQEDDDTPTTWHMLHKFLNKIETLGAGVEAFIEGFSFKADEEETDEICAETIPYLLVWDTILYVCSKAPAELRSVYTQWICRNNFETVLLPFLFKLLPKEVLKNPDSSMALGLSVFAPLEWKAVANDRLPDTRYSAHIYTQCLRFIPAIVRKWWNGSNQRQSALVDKITTNFVSTQLCQDEFSALIQRKDKNDNMSIKVAATSRQVTAVYSIDEAKLELIITLPVNYPLGAVKVESGKAIGGRLQSRQIVMQCTIFLTHQNGSIFDGLSLWKRNLDRKFEGVEECYICYAVIHQDTCQLPKLTCKTCKKKFHGPCLYKWFHTSNKSTCPICRNIF